jgi:hypothetical protein
MLLEMKAERLAESAERRTADPLDELVDDVVSARPTLSDVVPHDVFVDVQTRYDVECKTLLDALDEVQESNIDNLASLVCEHGIAEYGGSHVVITVSFTEALERAHGELQRK